jgi:hypothetical protein
VSYFRRSHLVATVQRWTSAPFSTPDTSHSDPVAVIEAIARKYRGTVLEFQRHVNGRGVFSEIVWTGRRQPGPMSCLQCRRISRRRCRPSGAPVSGTLGGGTR